MQIIAHRGASAEAPENTLAAFRRALELGAGMIELDVHLTADGIPVVIHDATLSRTSDGKGAVSDLPLESVRRLSAGEWYGGSFREEGIPTLEEVYELVGDRAEINVEIKGEPEETADGALGVVNGAGAIERTLFSSFDPRALERIRGSSASARLALLIGPGSLADPDTPLSGDPGARVLAHVARWAPLRLEGVSLHRLLASAGLVEALHERNLRVYVYTVDGLGLVRAMERMEVDGVFANDPAPLLRHWPAEDPRAAPV